MKEIKAYMLWLKWSSGSHNFTEFVFPSSSSPPVPSLQLFLRHNYRTPGLYKTRFEKYWLVVKHTGVRIKKILVPNTNSPIYQLCEFEQIDLSFYSSFIKCR